MRKPVVVLLIAVAVAAGGWFFLQKFEIVGLDNIRLVQRDPAKQKQKTLLGDDQPPVKHDDDTIRIASFNIQVFGISKSDKPRVMSLLAEIVKRFDVVAVQEIRSKDQGILPVFVDLINADGRKYDYIIGPRLGNTVSKEQYAFIFDRATIEVDRNQAYTVDDPGNRLHREPFVGMFRVRGPPTESAFTFTLVNIHTDPDETKTELNAVGEAYIGVRNDGRKEDDIIVLGDLNVDHRHFGKLGVIPGITWVISDKPTNTRGTKQYDNIVFHGPSTSEFTGRGGVFDFMHEYNLTMQSALEVSDHMPVWAEFSIYEGGKGGRVAGKPGGAMR